ncbi:MAG: hypothetical protein J3R72DRAFT_459651 [Linnemannia gamsii]|nr:MAG: hypothetical protein J3R72DRAFT_459651 [Linnemannia gamsii]
MTKSIFALAVATMALLLCYTVTVTAPPPPHGKTLALISPSKYCIFLPHWPDHYIDNDHSAATFCSTAIPSAPNAHILPTGFIKSVHWRSNTNRGYVQITGRFDRHRYQLINNDQGAQNDPNSPAGAKCAGYKYFVGFVEPNEEIYCLRCCKRKADCPTHRPTEGCRSVLGGNYT